MPATARGSRTSSGCGCAPAQGDLVPLRTVADVELITAPASIIRYNNLRSVTINGGPAPGYSSGEAIAAMEAVAAATLPPGYSYRVDRHGAAGEGGGRANRLDPRARDRLRLSVSRRRSTRAGRSRSPRCCRSSSACSARWRR